MKKTSTTVAIMTALAVCASVIGAKAGDPTRTAQSGASELLINPWASSSGWANANTSCVQGLEAQFLNVAGTAAITKTDVVLASTDYLDGSGLHLSAFGLTQHVGEAGALSLSIMSLNFGVLPITTFDNPEGGVGTFDPQFINIGVSYARSFSDQISGGLTMRLISESIANVSSFGLAVDAGIQYTAGSQKQIHFGISLKNVGPQMKYSGDGLAFETPIPNNAVTGNTGNITAEQRSQGYELPALINIGAAYDFHLLSDSSLRSDNRITVAANFTSNSFIQDDEMLGVEYGFKSFLMVRVGYEYENGGTHSLSTDPVLGGRLTASTGLAAGVTLQAPFGKTHNIFGITYSYRATQPFNGTHTIGVRITLK